MENGKTGNSKDNFGLSKLKLKNYQLHPRINCCVNLPT
jgi:hypothetical protein